MSSTFGTFTSVDVIAAKRFLLIHFGYWQRPIHLAFLRLLMLRLLTVYSSNGVARALKKLHTSKGDYWIKQWFSSIASLFKMGTSLKGKNLLPEGANSSLYEQFLILWKITFITWSDLPWMLLFLLCTCVTWVMGAMPLSRPFWFLKKLPRMQRVNLWREETHDYFRINKVYDILYIK